MRTLMISLMFGVVFGLGCADAQTSREASIAVDVADDQGRALSGVPILLDDTPIKSVRRKKTGGKKRR